MTSTARRDVSIQPAELDPAPGDYANQCTAALQFGNTGNFQTGDGGAAVDPCLIPAARPDSDGDGLYDDDELYVYGTDPSWRDTDGGGPSDGAEVYYGAIAGAEPARGAPLGPPGTSNQMQVHRNPQFYQ